MTTMRANHLGSGVRRVPELALALRLAGAILAGVVLVALLVRVAAAESARDWLGFTFPGIPREIDEGASIFLHNLSLLGALLAAVLVVQIGAWQSSANGRTPVALRICVLACDTAVGVSVLRHVVIVGSAVGAYGDRALGVLLPHGPVELGSFALALALFVTAHRGPLDGSRCLAVAGLSTFGLAAAALLEVFG